MNDSLPHIERLLREQAAPQRVPSPAGMQARIMSQIGAQPQLRLALSRPRRALVIVLPTSLAAAAALVFVLWPSPSPRPADPTSALAIGIPIDPTPVIRPAARFVSESLDQPLRDEATALVRDTRRATQFVVDCLPFARGG